MAPPCTSEDGNQAVLVATNLTNGDAVALCGECIVPWAAALLNGLTGVDPTPFLQAASAPAEVPAAAEGAPTDQPPAPAPADADHDAAEPAEQEGEAAAWVTEGAPPPTAGKPGGRTRGGRSSAVADTGGANGNGGENE
jgi:hypothetical protein